MFDMIDNKEDLGNAIALNSSIVNMARMVGPSLAGILIPLVGEGACFLINAVSFFPVIVTLFFIKIVQKDSAPKKIDVWRDWKEGIIYAVRFKPIGAILALLGVVSLMGMSYAVLMPVFVTKVFSGGARMMGFLMAASGLGALGGTFYLASRKSVVGLGRVIAVSAGILGVSLIVFAFSHLLWLSFTAMLVTGFGLIAEMASSNTILQTIVDDDKRGRIMSLYAMAFMGMAPLGSLQAGALASQIGAPATLVFSGLMCILGAFWFARLLPQLRPLVRPVYVRLGLLSEQTLDL
jgi:MFS family permease